MKILMLIDSFTVGGAQRQFTNIAKELNKSEDLTIVVYHPITSHFEEELNAEGVRIVKILKQSRYDLKFIVKLLKFVRKERFDVAISYLDTPNLYNVLAKITRSIPKVIVSQRSAYFKDTLSLKKRIQESLLYFADYITTNSITQKRRMEDIFPFLQGKIHFLPNVYEVPVIETKNNLKKRFIVLANTQTNKNPLQLCKALIGYKKLYGQPKFIIKWYGRISENTQDKNQFNEGVALLKENNLSNNLVFKGITDAPFQKIIESDLLIHISNFEGCPNSVCEAMAYKTPVLVSNVCDAPYLLNHNRGILVDQTDPKDIAKKIKQFEELDEIVLNKSTDDSQEFISNKFNRNCAMSVLNNLING